MSSETLLYICFAAIIAIIISVFMYGYKTKYAKKLRWILGSLRFLSLFAILLLLINPKFKTETFTVEKPKLPVLIDNSASIKELNQVDTATNLLATIKNNKALNEAFDVTYFSFGNDFKPLDSLTFSEQNTQLSKALKTTDQVYKSSASPIVLITDGNQTLGNDYEYSSMNLKTPVFPVILGDSTQYVDIKIEQLNTNRYSFLKNDFPVEVILLYSGKNQVNKQFVVKLGNQIVYKKSVVFSEKENSKTLSFTLPASRVGLLKYSAYISSIPQEKNKSNNYKQFAVEVIDQATNIVIVSDISHPDIGMLKKAIESNEQRKVTIKKPFEIKNVEDFQLLILYQPRASFANLFKDINKLKKNVLIITGLQTNWNFLNTAQNSFKKEVTHQTEDVEGVLNPNYGTFAIEDIDFEGFPPLYTLFGELEITVPHETILEQSIDGFLTETALLATSELSGRREAILDGEGFWRWRSYSFRTETSFKVFDDFISKLIQYLASNKRRSRLEVSNETFYYNHNLIKLSAQYFDENYVFDSRVSLQIRLTNKETKAVVEFPMLLHDNFFEVNVNTLLAGEYSYLVTVKEQPISRSGSFTILEYNVEKQFLNANVTKLRHVATNTNGKAFYASEINILLEELIADERFKSIQKSEQKIVPLIDWEYLLFIIIFALAIEWFIRKYNGLI